MKHIYFFFVLLIQFSFVSCSFAQDTTVLMKEGLKLVQSHQYSDAIKMFKHILDINPKYSRAYTLSGYCHEMMNNTDDAYACYNLGIETDDTDFLPYSYRAILYYSDNNPSKALKDLDICFKLKPDYEQIPYISALCLKDLNRHDDALISINKAFTLTNPNRNDVIPTYYLIRGEIHMHNSNFDAAMDDFEKALNIAKLNHEYIDLSELLDIIGNHKRSTRLCYDVLRLGSGYIHAGKVESNIGVINVDVTATNISQDIMYIGCAFYKLGDFGMSDKTLSHAINTYRKNAKAYYYRSLNRYHWGKSDGELDIDQSIKLSPYLANNYLLKSAFLIKTDPAEATVFAKKVIELRSWRDPDTITATIIGAIGAIKAGDQNSANSLLDDALKHTKKNIWPYPILKYLRGEFDENLINKSARTPDQKSDSRAVLGLKQIALGKKDKAIENFHWLLKQGNPRSLLFDVAINELRVIEDAKFVDQALEQYSKKLYGKNTPGLK